MTLFRELFRVLIMHVTVLILMGLITHLPTFHKVHSLVQVHLSVGHSHTLLERILIVNGIIAELALVYEFTLWPEQL